MEKEIKTEKPVIIENADKQQENSKRVIGRPFPKGVSGNIKGRPKGKTMKEFAKDFLMSMTDKEKVKWLEGLSPEMIWRMAEGNPANNMEITPGGEPLFQPTAEERVKAERAIKELL